MRLASHLVVELFHTRILGHLGLEETRLYRQSSLTSASFSL
jgi:hypothetical protein